LLGRLAPSLGYNTKQKVLVPAFSRALKDPFVHARVAGLMAFMATVDCFDIPNLAAKVIPSMAFCLVDEEKYACHCNLKFPLLNVVLRLVRDQAFKALDLFTKKIHAYATDMVRILQ
jgi:SCY1-like protein 1